MNSNQIVTFEFKIKIVASQVAIAPFYKVVPFPFIFTNSDHFLEKSFILTIYSLEIIYQSILIKCDKYTNPKDVAEILSSHERYVVRVN